MTRRNPDLGCAFDWLKICFNQSEGSTTQIWEATRHQYGISAHIPHAFPRRFVEEMSAFSTSAYGFSNSCLCHLYNLNSRVFHSYNHNMLRRSSMYYNRHDGWLESNEEVAIWTVSTRPSNSRRRFCRSEVDTSAFNKLRDILERKGSQWDCAVGHFYVGRFWFVSRAEDGEWCNDEHDCCNSCEFKKSCLLSLLKLINKESAVA